MVTRDDYPDDEAEAARSVLLELAHVLGEYKEDLVLVGGWVPPFLCPEAAGQHTGSLDVDLAVNHSTIDEAGYLTIHQHLIRADYYQKPDGQPFQYYRKVPVKGREIVVEIDFLAGEYGGTAPAHRHQRVQDMQPRKARGCDLAFEGPAEVRIVGRLPDGTQDSSVLRVAAVAPFIIMKSIALARREKAKDAWDIDFCLRNYPSGLDALADEFRLYQKHSLAQEGLAELAGKFRNEADYGPKRVADFEGLLDDEEREIRQQDAYQRVRYLLEKLGCA